MAKGNSIVLTVEPKGVFKEGLISGTPKPGVGMQPVAATEPIGGKHTWEVFTSGDGHQTLVAILLENYFRGLDAVTAYVTGEQCRMYCPIPGDELNVLLQDVSGTGDDHAIGDKLIMDSGTGKFIATTGSPEMEPFIVMETITDPTADTLCHAMYTGH